MHKRRLMAWGVWFMGSLFYAYQYILRVMPNIMLDDIMETFHMDAALFGQYAGIYYIGYSLLHLPIGIMLDRYGPRLVMSLCILLSVLGLTPLLFAQHWIYPILGRLLMGIGSSAAILGTFKIIRMNFAEKYFARMLSLSVTIGLIGAIYGGGPVSYMCETMGYQEVVKIFACLGLGLALLTYLLVPSVKPEKQGKIMTNVWEVVTNGRVLSLCFLAGLMVGPLEGFADVWGSEFLKRIYDFKGDVCDTLPSMIFIGMCFGAPALSFMAEKSGHYLGTIMGAGIFMMVSFLLLLLGLFNETTTGLSFVGIGVCCAYQILAIYKATTYVPERLVGLTTAVANMIIMIFGSFFHSSIGFIIKTYGGVGEKEALLCGIGIIPLSLGIGVLGFIIMALKDKRPS